MVRNTEFYSVIGLGALEMAKMAGQAWRMQVISTGTEIDAINPAINFLLDYTGDFYATYAVTWILNNFKRGYSKRKLNISSVMVLGAAVIVETAPVFGTPRIEDLPAAVAGVLAYRAVNKYLRNNLPAKSQ